ncbi:MAG: hypothetical protein NWE93_02550 [Candidatus Bathyarchaeota archaeon]|nr:hypothetical protein [Candidatus Bathyarchaeota archaeon]
MSFKIRLYAGRRKDRIIAVFGGIIAAYVFVDLIPNIASSNELIKEIADSQTRYVYEESLFLVVFVGFLIFFSLEYLAVTSQKTIDSASQKSKSSKGVYVVHFAALAFLEFVLSYILLFEYKASVIGGVLFTFAVALHLFIADNTLADNYGSYITRNGRYLASAIPLFGWAASVVFPEKTAAAYLLLAFVSGSILYMAIKDEIPTRGQKRFLALFLAGAISYTLLLVAYSLVG